MELDFGLLVLRLCAGLIFAAHGAQKAFGWWGGPGVAGWLGAMERMHFRPRGFFAGVSIAIELIGGLLLVVGLLTPFALAAFIGQSIVIIVIAHLARGFWAMNGGIEFPLTLAAIVTALAATGPGRVSLDVGIGLSYLEPPLGARPPGDRRRARGNRDFEARSPLGGARVALALGKAGDS